MQCSILIFLKKSAFENIMGKRENAGKKTETLLRCCIGTYNSIALTSPLELHSIVVCKCLEFGESNTSTVDKELTHYQTTNSLR